MNDMYECMNTSVLNIYTHCIYKNVISPHI